MQDTAITAMSAVPNLPRLSLGSDHRAAPMHSVHAAGQRNPLDGVEPEQGCCAEYAAGERDHELDEAAHGHQLARGHRVLEAPAGRFLAARDLGRDGHRRPGGVPGGVRVAASPTSNAVVLPLPLPVRIGAWKIPP